ncbi:MAG: relaxase/mobilization nuclease domain-containing protein [Hydrogenoanaerobacterium sp.]
MAIVNPIKVRVGNLAGFRGVLDYIKADFKTQDGELVFGEDCLPEKAFEQMLITKKAFRKDSGRQYAHFVQSFYRYDDLTPEQAMEIGQKFMERYERFKDFQVCAAVHTNGPQLHIHYVVNTVSFVDGHKWQSSPEDLKQMRSISDDLCREYGLQVYEKQFSGHRSYGEYTAKHSWKKQLAEEAARCIQASGNPADFKLLLEDCGVGCDIGKTAILFTVQAGTHGLTEERKCSNKKLMSYGDFSSENILQSINFNGFVLDEAWHDFPLVSEVLGLLGAIDHPDDPGIYERTFLNRMNPEDFKGKTKLQIEQMLTERKHQALIAMQTREIRERIAAEQAQNSILHSSIAGLFEQFEEWLWEKKRQEKQEQNMVTKEAENDEEDEFELY